MAGTLIRDQRVLSVLAAHFAIEVGKKICEQCGRHPSLAVGPVNARHMVSHFGAAGFLVLANDS